MVQKCVSSNMLRAALMSIGLCLTAGSAFAGGTAGKVSPEEAAAPPAVPAPLKQETPVLLPQEEAVGISPVGLVPAFAGFSPTLVIPVSAHTTGNATSAPAGSTSPPPPPGNGGTSTPPGNGGATTPPSTGGSSSSGGTTTTGGGTTIPPTTASNCPPGSKGTAVGSGTLTLPTISTANASGTASAVSSASAGLAATLAQTAAQNFASASATGAAASDAQAIGAGTGVATSGDLAGNVTAPVSLPVSTGITGSGAFSASIAQSTALSGAMMPEAAMSATPPSASIGGQALTSGAAGMASFAAGFHAIQGVMSNTLAAHSK